jgi:hypothetical protein
MPIRTDTERPNLRPRRWLLALGLTPLVLLVVAVAFLAWLPSQGYDGIPLGGGTIASAFEDYDVAVGITAGAHGPFYEPASPGLTFRHFRAEDVEPAQEAISACIGHWCYVLAWSVKRPVRHNPH